MVLLKSIPIFSKCKCFQWRILKNIDKMGIIYSFFIAKIETLHIIISVQAR